MMWSAFLKSHFLSNRSLQLAIFKLYAETPKLNLRSQTELLAQSQTGAEVTRSIATYTGIFSKLKALGSKSNIRRDNREADVARCDDGEPWQPANEEESFMLSLDGGGIRGFVLLEVLLLLERRRKQLYPTAPHFLSKFNWITGNSAGGIAALAFAAARAGASRTLTSTGKDECCEKLLNQSRRIFIDLFYECVAGKPPIPNDKVNKIFEEAFGSTKMSDIDESDVKLCVMTTLATHKPLKLHIMSNYGGARNTGQDPPNKQLVWKAARATSAFPLIFQPQDKKYIDGGMIANNPTTDAIIDMYKHSKKEKKVPNLKMVLSIGCGFNKLEKLDVTSDIKTPTNFSKITGRIVEKLSGVNYNKLNVPPHWSIMALLIRNRESAQQYAKILYDQVTQPNERVQERSEFVTELLQAQYFRINPGPLEFADDETKLEYPHNILDKMSKMYFEVHRYMRNTHNLEKVIDPVLHYIYGGQNN